MLVKLRTSKGQIGKKVRSCVAHSGLPWSCGQFFSLKKGLPSFRQKREASWTCLVQIGEVRQQLVEAHRQCSQQQATVVHLHDQLLTARKQLQVLQCNSLLAVRSSGRNSCCFIPCMTVVIARDCHFVCVCDSLQMVDTLRLSSLQALHCSADLIDT